LCLLWFPLYYVMQKYNIIGLQKYNLNRQSDSTKEINSFDTCDY